jgi:hypothetical protein
MEQSDQINELATALAKAQGVMVNVVADQKASIPTRAGGTYSYTYADLGSVLNAIRKPLSENGLCIMQGIHEGQNAILIMTELAHSSGQWVRSELAIPISPEATPQNIGSVITYGRRYGLSALIGIASEDDDAKSATEEKPTERPRQAIRPQAPAKPAAKSADSQESSPSVERHQRMTKAALARWSKQSGDTVAVLIGRWLGQKGYGNWAEMTEEKQEEAIAKMQEEAELA